MAPKLKPHIKWLNSYAKVSEWMKRWPPLHRSLKQGHGIVKISGLFPTEVAEVGIPKDKTFDFASMFTHSCTSWMLSRAFSQI